MKGRASLADVPFFLSDSYLPGFIRWWILYPQCDKNTKLWKLHIQVSSHYNSSVKGCLSLFFQWCGVHAVKWLLLWLTPKLWLIHLILCARILFCLPSHARWLSAHTVAALSHIYHAHVSYFTSIIDVWDWQPEPCLSFSVHIRCCHWFLLKTNRALPGQPGWVFQPSEPSWLDSEGWHLQ